MYSVRSQAQYNVKNDKTKKKMPVAYIYHNRRLCSGSLDASVQSMQSRSAKHGDIIQRPYTLDFPKYFTDTSTYYGFHSR